MHIILNSSEWGKPMQTMCKHKPYTSKKRNVFFQAWSCSCTKSYNVYDLVFFFLWLYDKQEVIVSEAHWGRMDGKMGIGVNGRWCPRGWAQSTLSPVSSFPATPSDNHDLKRVRVRRANGQLWFRGKVECNRREWMVVVSKERKIPSPWHAAVLANLVFVESRALTNTKFVSPMLPRVAKQQFFPL